MYEPIVPDILFKQARDILVRGHHDQMLRPKCTSRAFGIGTHLFFSKNTTTPVLRLLSHSVSVWASMKLLTLNKTPYYQALINFDHGGAQWLSVWLETEGPRVWASPASLRCVLEQDILINPSLVMVQPTKTCPYITERLLMGRKESNQTNKTWIMDPKL